MRNFVESFKVDDGEGLYFIPSIHVSVTKQELDALLEVGPEDIVFKDNGNWYRKDIGSGMVSLKHELPNGDWVHAHPEVFNDKSFSSTMDVEIITKDGYAKFGYWLVNNVSEMLDTDHWRIAESIDFRYGNDRAFYVVPKGADPLANIINEWKNDTPEQNRVARFL